MFSNKYFFVNISLKYRKCPNRLKPWPFGNFYGFMWRQVCCFKNECVVFHLSRVVISGTIWHVKAVTSLPHPTPTTTTGQIPRGTVVYVNFSATSPITIIPQTKVKTHQGFFLFFLNPWFLKLHVCVVGTMQDPGDSNFMQPGSAILSKESKQETITGSELKKLRDYWNNVITNIFFDIDAM